MKRPRLAIIDPVGMKAGLDHYDVSLASDLNSKFFVTDVYSNFAGDVNSPFVIKHFDFKIESGKKGIPGLFLKYNSAFRKAKLVETQFVILHLFHSSLFDFLIIRLAKWYGFRIILIIHDVESFIQGKGKSWLKNCVTISDFIIVHNDFTLTELLKKINPGDKEKIFIVPHGNFSNLVVKVNRKESIRYFNLDPEKKYLLFFGMIKRTKGLKLLLEAMKNIQEDVHLIIAGRLRDESFNEYDSLIKANNLEERVHSFLRYISNDERNMLFNISRLAILPYSRIYQSGILILAMSYEVSVVASDLPANKSMIEDDRGFLFRTDDENDLTAKINFALSDPDKCKLFAMNAKANVEKNNSWDKIGNEIINILG